MTLVFLQYPALWIPAILSLLLNLLAVKGKRGGLVLTILAALCVIAMVIAALVCSLPYTELLMLVLVPVVACLFATERGRRP